MGLRWADRLLQYSPGSSLNKSNEISRIKDDMESGFKSNRELFLGILEYRYSVFLKGFFGKIPLF